MRPACERLVTAAHWKSPGPSFNSKTLTAWDNTLEFRGFQSVFPSPQSAKTGCPGRAFCNGANSRLLQTTWRAPSIRTSEKARKRNRLAQSFACPAPEVSMCVAIPETAPVTANAIPSASPAADPRNWNYKGRRWYRKVKPRSANWAAAKTRLMATSGAKSTFPRRKGIQRRGRSKRRAVRPMKVQKELLPKYR